jgi:hypothetical protein
VGYVIAVCLKNAATVRSHTASNVTVSVTTPELDAQKPASARVVRINRPQKHYNQQVCRENSRKKRSGRWEGCSFLK